ncbi:MBL fold metallo-hydrolase [Bacillus massiliglaciei]|uniref:MBL fold metallo-hydrolase n=1 Tax=Bacillus massiliglaciei TaxID=1816693 RepID=UPI000AF3B5C0|nr:MBL fold metallo-hydrolase [Bacillus massiliglaciei]
MVIWNGNIAKLSLPTPFAVGDVNVYLLKGDALTLIDTGAKTEQSREVLEGQLKELGLSIKDIEQVVLTHHHPDHAGGLDLFDQAVPVYGHKNIIRWLEGGEDFLHYHNEFFMSYAGEFGVGDEWKRKLLHPPGENPLLCERKLDGVLSGGDELPGHPDFIVTETLGHAQSHISFFRERDGVMIGGDHLLDKISPNPVMEPPILRGGERPRPLLQYNASLKGWKKMPISMVYTGHGREVTEINRHISSQMERQHARAMLVKGFLEKPRTGFEICQFLFPKVYQKELGLTLSETIGQLDYLEDLGLVKKELQDEIALFSAV